MKLLISLCAVLLLAGCMSSLEMPKDPIGTDEMRPSPCACAEIDYEFSGFEWDANA